MCIRLLSLKSLTSTIYVWLHNDITNHWWIGEACIGGPVNARLRSPDRKAQADERAIKERMRNKDIGNYFILMLTLSWDGLWDCINPILGRAPETLILGGFTPPSYFWMEWCNCHNFWQRYSFRSVLSKNEEIIQKTDNVNWNWAKLAKIG